MTDPNCIYPDWEGGLTSEAHAYGTDGFCSVCGDKRPIDPKPTPTTLRLLAVLMPDNIEFLECADTWASDIEARNYSAKERVRLGEQLDASVTAHEATKIRLEATRAKLAVSRKKIHDLQLTLATAEGEK